jgi:signal recognition particle subunit SRP72
LLKFSNCDPETAGIIRSNLTILSSSESNPFVVQKNIEEALSETVKSKMFKYQENVVVRNRLVSRLLCGQADGVQSRTNSELASKSPTVSSNLNVMSVINTAASCEARTGKMALKLISELSTKRPEDVGLRLTAVQLHLGMKNPSGAISVLEGFLSELETSKKDIGSVRYSPGLVALAVSLYGVQGRQACIKAELLKACAYWTKRPDQFASSLLCEAGVELLKSRHPDDVTMVRDAFSKVNQIDKQNKVAISGLIASSAHVDDNNIKSLLHELPPVSVLTAGVGVADLIAQGVASVETPTNRNKKRIAEAELVRKRKKRCKGRLPKFYEEGKKVDPERWLPLRDRTSYRPKGKKGKKKQGETTQGGLVKEEETLELVGGAGAVKVEKSTNTASKKKRKGKK